MGAENILGWPAKDIFCNSNLYWDIFPHMLGMIVEFITFITSYHKVMKLELKGMFKSD